MSDAPEFFDRAPSLSIAEIIALTGAEAYGASASAPDHPGGVMIDDVAALDSARPGTLVFFDNARYAEQLNSTNASACLVKARFAGRVPTSVMALCVDDPYRAYAQVASYFYPTALRAPGAYDVDPARAQEGHRGTVHPKASLETGVIVEPGAVIGAGAAIGAETVICAGAVIGANVQVGRRCRIGTGATISYALLGDNVIIHSGVRIGQDGFGFAMGATGHTKVPQFGRVIIQDHVEIGANSCVDRGANRDTIIGEGSKIDNLVQIGHNVVIGRHCIVVSQTGIAGSAVLEDFVALGGQVGVVGHVRIGAGAQIAASSNVRSDVPPGVRWGGTPAKPVRTWFRELTVLKTLAERGNTSGQGQ